MIHFPFIGDSSALIENESVLLNSLFGMSVLALFWILTLYLGKTKMTWRRHLAAVAIAIASILFLVGFVALDDNGTKMDRANVKITEALKEKYGVTLKEPPIREWLAQGIGDDPRELTLPNGKDAEATIMLSDDKQRIFVYIGEKELAKVPGYKP